MTRLIVLPGLDGSGSLLGPFVDAMGPDVTVSVLTYPPDRPLDYAGLAALIAPQLPEAKPFHLLGESFGGPLAIMLAARSHQQLRSLVLCASFLHFPQPLLRALAPLGGFAHAALVPDPLLSWFTFGTWSTPTKMPTLRASIQELSGETLRCRLRAVLRVDVASLLPTITAPILYLQATDDRIVPASAARAIQRIAPAACIEPIAGPHLLLQTQPKTCAREIRRHLDAIGDPATPL